MNSRSPLSLRDLAFSANVGVRVLRVSFIISIGGSLPMAVHVGRGSVGVFSFPIFSGVFLGVICGCIGVEEFMWLARLLTIEVRFTILLCSSLWSFLYCVVRAWYSR